MTITEAHEFALGKVAELRDNGIETIIKKYDLTSPGGQSAVRKYDGEITRIHPEKWVKVTFKNVDKEQVIKIHEAANYLGMCGIAFDTGGYHGCRNWELDWSFRYTGKEDEGWREAREDVEDMINGIQ